MLRALVHNKDRSLNLETKDGQISINLNYRDIYPQTEDFFTAAVFSRLCYLEDEIFTDILNMCTGKTFDFGPLIDRNFWPSWEHPKWARVEPDVFMRFEKCDVIVEAKRYDGDGQFKEQIEKEITAYRHIFSISKPAYLFAVGGISSDFKLVIENTEWCAFTEIIPMTWQVLYENIKKYDRMNIFIKEDLLLAFELQGIQELLFLIDITNNDFNKLFVEDYQKTVEAISSYNDKEFFSILLNLCKITDYKNTAEVLQWE